MKLEELVAELRGLVSFKETTGPGDLVLIAADNPRMLLYGQVVSIMRDTSRRDQWWNVTFHLLSIPPQEVVWTLREPQFTGREIFTMGGDKRFMQAIELPASVQQGGAEDDGGVERKLKGGKPILRLK